MLSNSLSAALLICVPGAVTHRPVAEFELPDLHGKPVRLSEYRDDKLVVVVFLGTKCPLARLYASRLGELADEYAASGVAFLAIDPNAADSRAEVSRFANDHKFRFPVLLDERAAVADNFGASRQLEVFVLNDERRVVYHGRVDDQYRPGVPRGEPTRQDLRTALEELLAGQAVTVEKRKWLAASFSGR